MKSLIHQKISGEIIIELNPKKQKSLADVTREMKNHAEEGFLFGASDKAQIIFGLHQCS